MAPLIRTEIEGGVAAVPPDRPEKRNALADDKREHPLAAPAAVAARPDARVLVITGAGRAFCSGGDVKHMVALKERGEPFEALLPLLEAGRRVVTRLATLPIPTIAAVNGPAAGAGAHLALACDLRAPPTRPASPSRSRRSGCTPTGAARGSCRAPSAPAAPSR